MLRICYSPQGKAYEPFQVYLTDDSEEGKAVIHDPADGTLMDLLSTMEYQQRLLHLSSHPVKPILLLLDPAVRATEDGQEALTRLTYVRRMFSIEVAFALPFNE